MRSRKAASTKVHYMFRVRSKRANDYSESINYYDTERGVNQKLAWLNDEELISVEYIEANWKPVTNAIAPRAAARLYSRAFNDLTQS